MNGLTSRAAGLSLRKALTPAAFEQAWSVGQALFADDAVAYALRSV